ncbi:MAG TPA: hypothetical protein VFU86_00240 [Terriglobales bacterium]|nr:hypothetical protein [Terriglobales bacterium]
MILESYSFKAPWAISFSTSSLATFKDSATSAQTRLARDRLTDEMESAPDFAEVVEVVADKADSPPDS